MPSITTWTRLEPQCRANDVAEGLAARIEDPLWLLARQWQVGEFQGEDTGSPVVARWRGQVAKFSRSYLGPIPPNARVEAPRFDPEAMPIETLVERQPVQKPTGAAAPADGLRLGVEYGQHFLRLLAAEPTTTDYRNKFVALYPVLPLVGEARAGLDPQTLRFADLVAGRALDGRRLSAALGAEPAASPRLDPALGIRPGDVAEIQKVASAWLRFCDTLFSEPAKGSAQAWQPNRQEYAFSLATRLGSDQFGERTLSAAEYYDGHLDWYSFDLNAEVASGTAADPPGAIVTQSIVPAPVTFKGMPAARFWEFEDAQIDVGLMQVGATDLPHLLLIEYMGVYGNDWFVIPIELPVGSVAETRSLVVTDTFGVHTLLRPNGDHSLASSSGGKWNMFQLAMQMTPAPARSIAVTNLFFLAPSLAKPIEGAALEEVLLLRDETANMAWAIERRLESPMETGLDRGSDKPAVPEARAPTEMPRYRVASAVPPHWIPLLPTRVDSTTGEMRLTRASLLAPDATRQSVSPQGRLLFDDANPTAPLLLHEEEVPREGVVVRRAYQAARWFDGTLFLWAGNRKSVGRGEGSSGLAYDAID
jgi:hypothetical protein